MRGNRTRALVTLYSTIENGKHRTTVMFAVSSAYSVLVEKRKQKQRNPTDRVTCSLVLLVTKISESNQQRPVVAGQLALAQEGADSFPARRIPYFRKWKALLSLF